MRIHGSYKISRRTSVDKKSYNRYVEELREDFHHICGYCGKSEVVATKGFEIDHFVPRTIAVERKDEYQNLVYSCFTCNRKKGNKWPTGDPNRCNDGKVGFVDPTSEEYDQHLTRNEKGSIVPLSPLGEYLCSQAFKFNNRPTDTVWKAMKIIALKKRLQEKTDRLSQDEMQEYIFIDQELEALMNYIFAKKE